MDQFGECDNATSDAQHPLLYGGTFIHLQYHMFMETCRYEKRFSTRRRWWLQSVAPQGPRGVFFSERWQAGSQFSPACRS